MNEERIERIREMELCFGSILLAFRENPDGIFENEDITAKIRALADYMDSGMWLSDYEADERGELPPDLKRGVLSQDGLYNLLYEIEKAF